MNFKPVRWSAVIAAVVSATVLAGCSGLAAPPQSPELDVLHSGFMPEALPPVPPGVGATELAKQHFRASNFGYAAQYFEEAVAADRDNAEAWLGLAAAYDRLRRFDLADRAYAEAAERAGGTAEYHNNRGFSYLLRGERANARRSFAKALELAPDSPTIRNNLELLRKAAARTAQRDVSSLAAG